MQAWKLCFNDREYEYKASSTYEEIEYSEESEEDQEDPDVKEEKKVEQKIVKKQQAQSATAADGDDEEEKKEADNDDDGEEEDSKQLSGANECNPLGVAINKLNPEKAAKQEALKPQTKVVPSENVELVWTKAVDHTNNSYLVLVNQTGRTIKEGEQIMFYYGKYTNAYLLTNYGFCYRDNMYDQFDVSLEMRPASMNPVDMLCFDYERADGIQAIQLKCDRLDNIMMCYLRLLIQTDTMFPEEPDDEDADADKQTKASNTSQQIDEDAYTNFTKVTDLNQERKVLDLYKKVLIFVLRKTEEKTTLE